MRVFLGKNVRGEGIEVFVLRRETRCIFARVLLHLLEAWQNDGIVGKVIERAHFVDGTVNETQVMYREAAGQGICYLDNGPLAHAVRDEIGPRIEQDGALEAIRPVIVMRETTQTRLDTAEDDGRLLIRAANEIAVDDAGAIGAQASRASR